MSLVVHAETTAVELRAVASTNPFNSTPAGYAIRVSVSNESLRPIIIRSMELKVAGRPVAPVRTFLLGTRAETGAGSLADQPIEDAQSLPMALPERGAQTLTAFADFSGAAFQAERERQTPLLARARQFCHELGTDPSTGPAEGQAKSLRPRPSTAELEIDADPGGTQTVPVLISTPVRGPNIWRMDVTGPAAHPNGMVFWRRIAAPTALRLLTVKVWTWDGHLERTVSLPVVGAAYSEVRFRRLEAGGYRAALLDNREPLAVGRFDVPLKKSNEVIYPSDAQVVNGECLRIEGKHDIYDYKRTPYEPAGN